MSSIKLGENIKARIKGDKLTLTIDLSKKGKKSKTGKSMVIASTGRMTYLRDLGEEYEHHGLGLNLFQVRKKYRRK